MTKSISVSCSSTASERRVRARALASIAFLSILAAGLTHGTTAHADEPRGDEPCGAARSRYLVAPNASTLHLLAKCHEDQGKTASAWAEYLEAQSLARREKRTEVELAAKHRAKAIEPRLTKLLIVVSRDAAVDGLDVKRDGTAMDRGVWGSAVPIDPGEHVVTASAPGRTPWTRKVLTRPGASTTAVEIPVLASAGEPVGTTTVSSASLDTSSYAMPEGSTDSRGGLQRAVGLGLLGLGIAGAALGTYFGVQTLSKSDAAEKACPASPCTDASAVALNDEAKRAGTISTVSFAAAGGAILIGSIVFFTAPRNGPRVSVSTAPSFAGVNVGGSF